MENRKELLNSSKKNLERLSKELELNEKNKINLLSQNKELIKLYEIEYASAKQLIDKGLSSKSKLSLASFNLANAKAAQKDIEIKYESQLSNIESQIANVNSELKNIQLDIENTSIKKTSENYKKYYNLAKVKIASNVYNSYDTYLRNKYEIEINRNALEKIKN